MIFGSAPADETALGGSRVLRNNVDDSIHGVGAPDRPARPRITSMRSISSSGASTMSQKTPENEEL